MRPFGLRRRAAHALLLVAALLVHLAASAGAVSSVGLAALGLAIGFAALVPLSDRWGGSGARLAGATAAIAAVTLPAGDPWPLGLAADGRGLTAVPVLISAGLLLEADRALRFAAAFRGAGAPVGTRSLAAAGCLALAADRGLAALPVAGGAPTTAPLGFALAALHGGTVVHRILILDFLLVIALLGFAVAGHLRDRRAFQAALATGGADAAADSRSAALVRRRDGRAGAAVDLATLDQLKSEERRMIRALVQVLPLLGFIGTVIGLATAIAGLAPGETGTPDLAASLAGLAVKFETTLLGLGGAVVASLLLMLLERSEGEFAAFADHRLAGEG